MTEPSAAESADAWFARGLRIGEIDPTDWPGEEPRALDTPEVVICDPDESAAHARHIYTRAEAETCLAELRAAIDRAFPV